MVPAHLQGRWVAGEEVLDAQRQLSLLFRGTSADNQCNAFFHTTSALVTEVTASKGKSRLWGPLRSSYYQAKRTAPFAELWSYLFRRTAYN